MRDAVAPDQAAAKKIADAAIASHIPSKHKIYDLLVTLPGNRDAWEIDLYRKRVTLSDRSVVTSLSPSYSLTIDRCSGSVLSFSVAL